MRLALALLVTVPLAGCTDEGLAPPFGTEGGPPAYDAAASADRPPTVDDLAVVLTGDGPLQPGDGPTTSAVDLATRADFSGMSQTIACGPNMSCDVPQLACCSATYGITGTCGAANAGCANVQVLKFLCDGDEDCKNGDTCCYHPQGGSQCEKGCNAIGTRAMCHKDQDCGNAKCCSLGLNTPYMACMVGICPF